MNLVAGASGMLGFEICRQLAAAGQPLRAMVRATTDPARRDALKSMGANLVYADLKDPVSLENACRGASTVISTASSTFSRQAGDSIERVDDQGQIDLVRAAKGAGVRYVVFISFPPAPEDFALQRAKRAVERELAESGLDYTILQPTFFTEVWLSSAVGFDAAGSSARIYGSGQNKVSWISYRDVARYAVASAGNSLARNRVIGLGGPEALSPLEVVGIFEEVSGRKFTVSHVSEEALRAQKAAAGDSLQEAFPALMLFYARGDVIDPEPALRIFRIPPSELGSVRSYATHVVRGVSA